MVRWSALPCATALGAFALCSIAAPGTTFAASHEQIIAKCKEAARPRVVQCVLARGGNRGTEGIIAACRESVGRPLVMACVQREEQKIAAGKAPPPAPKAETPAMQGTAAIEPSFVAPPRTVADITAILDSEKPNEAQIAERKARADAPPPSNASGEQLAQFYYDRGATRALLSRNQDAIDDALQALKTAKGLVLVTRIRQLLALQYRVISDPKQAVAVYQAIARDATQPGKRGALINALVDIADTLYYMGDLDGATTYARRGEALVQEARGSPNPQWREAYAIYGNYWEGEAERARALVFRARGQYTEAEAAERRAEAFHRAALKDRDRYASPPPAESMLQHADLDLLNIAYTEAKQGRLSEAEADARRALLEILKMRGRYNSATPRFILGLAMILIKQGRYPEAEKLTRAALETQRTLGIGDDASISAKVLSQLASILMLEGKTADANAVYAQLDTAIAHWPPERREALNLNGARIMALYASGQVDAGIAAAEELVKRQTTRTGATSFDTAEARGTLAIGYAHAGRATDAIGEFKAAIPIMTTALRESADDDDDPTIAAGRNRRLRLVVEAYIKLLARSGDMSNQAAVETFGLADAVRGRSVQQALADSSARMVANDPALTALVRKDQDLGKEIGAELGIINNMLALPSDQRDDQKVRAINTAIETLRANRKSAEQEIKRRFPAFDDLVDPRPPSIQEIKAALRPGEALLSFYFGQTASFVWAVPKDGSVLFTQLPVTESELSAKVHRLRQALEPQVARVEEIPPFDLALAYDLYSLLLKPIEPSWQSAKSLIVVTNGALGELPLSLLPTAPAAVDLQAKPLFSGYRAVPWLARSHAVTVVPSAAALVTLRHLPPGSANRDRLIGFGDPYFTADQAAEAEGEPTAAPAQVALAASGGDTTAIMRGAPLKLRAAPHLDDVDVAELAMLPRLPDTRLELIAMAEALEIDPAKALYLGKAANEHNVETLDLSHYRIVAFATHGLAPGDIDGLTQPALALTAPDVAGIKGDGLLTMEEILGLRLSADWVVLSACNTAAGAGAGAEAVSGLGSAFFYAGSRALLVTNWSVESTSARALTTDIFRRQSADPSLSRGEALRQAMMALLDGPGELDASGDTVFSYAHPLFWAPYSVIGDSGGD